jgi:hypothetical protein
MASIINATTSTGRVSSADNSGSLQLATNNGTTAVTIDTTQKVGIGTSSPASPLDVVAQTAASVARFRGRSSDNIATLEWYNNANTTRYTYISSSASATSIYNEANTPMVFGTNDTERMRIDSSGNLLIGRTSSDGYRVAALGSTQITSGYQLTYSGVAAGSLTLTSGGAMAFGLDAATGSTERMRIASNGTATLTANASGDQVAYITNTASSNPYGIQCTFLNVTPNNTTNTFFIGADSTNTKVFIYSSGTISNRTGTYNTISDAKLKENISDATPKLNKLMDVKVRNYNLIGDELKQIGFVAQELETIFPSLIDNVPDLDENKQPTGEVTKGVKLTVMIPILVKALQELNAKVEAQAVRIAELEGAK